MKAKKEGERESGKRGEGGGEGRGVGGTSEQKAEKALMQLN